MDDDIRFLRGNRGSTDRLRTLAESTVLARAVDLDAQLSERRPFQSLVYWRATPTQASAVGYRLVAFDREARRATRILLTGDAGLARPTRMSMSGFEIRDAGPGSLELILLAIGATADVLLSDPVQLILTTRALVGDVRRVGGWIGRHLPWSDRPSLPEVREVVESVVREREDTHIETPGLSWGDRGPIVRGAVDVTIVRIYPDGGTDIIRFDGAGPRR